MAPNADWSTAWAELTGYVTQARDDGEQIDPAELLRYLAELKRRALAPIRAWLEGGVTSSVSDEAWEHDYDAVVEIIEDEIHSYVRAGLTTCLAGLGDYGDEPAQRKIVDQVQHLHLAEPWLPAVAAAKRLREAGLAGVQRPGSETQP